jgi:glutamate formiminotransferase
MLECVMNVSEGRDAGVLAALRAAAGRDCLDVHADPFHHRAVFTLVGADAPRALAAEAIARIDLRQHSGVHPRIGVVDVVPFVALEGSTETDALAARDAFGDWAAGTLGVPGFAYGPERSLPDVRRRAFTNLKPTWGPPAPHPTAGAACVGVRPLLVAYNVWLVDADLALARQVAAAVRGPDLRTLGLQVGDRVQVSMNLVAPERLGPAAVVDLVAGHEEVAGTELVGLIPEAVLMATDPARWAELDLAAERTIEARLALRG